MLDNSGEKIKSVASGICALGITLSIIAGIVFVAKSISLYNNSYAFSASVFYVAFGAILTAAIGSFVSWVVSLLMTGFGDLICSQQQTERATQEILKRLNSTPKYTEAPAFDSTTEAFNMTMDSYCEEPIEEEDEESDL